MFFSDGAFLLMEDVSTYGVHIEPEEIGFNKNQVCNNGGWGHIFMGGGGGDTRHLRSLRYHNDLFMKFILRH